MKQRSGWTLLALLALTGQSAAAQFSPVTIPKKLFRIELGGEFRNADSRFNGGVTEDLGRSFTANPLGSGFFPTLAASEAAIGQIIGNTNYRLSAGQSVANGIMNIGTASIGVSYGLTSRITLFTTVPIVRTRMQLRLHFDSAGADAGFNPNDPFLGTPAGRSQTIQFFGELDAALLTLAAKIQGGDYDGNPADKALAQSALNQGTAIRSGLTSVYQDPDAPFVPTAGSSAGTALIDSIATLQSTIANLSVAGFATLPPLAANAASPDEITSLLSNPGGPIRGFPVRDAVVNLLGDIEGGVAITLIDSWNRHGPTGGVRAAITGALRFPTGTLDRPDDFLEIGTGSGYMAARVTGTLDLGRGRIGARVTGGYEHGFTATIQRRVASPFQPFPFASRLADVSLKPGGLLDLSVTPFLRIAPSLAIIGGVRLRHRAQDDVSFASSQDSLPGVNPGDLALATNWNLTSFQAGITYVSPASADITNQGFPVEASWTIEGPLSGSGGLVAKERVMRVQFRMYMRLF
ncbi:MAG: hypothetical protein ABI679_16590 [Gemmatimonadota bacterium]